jgi:two-component system sensor histidine kinase RpfC
VIEEIGKTVLDSETIGMADNKEATSWRQKTRDPEYQQSVVRFALLFFGLSYLGLGVYSRYYPISFLQYLTFAALFSIYTVFGFLHVRRYPGIRIRPFIMLGIDIFSVTVALVMTGGSSSPFFILYIWIYISYGVRFGRAILFTGSGLSLLCFVTVLVMEGSWSQKTFEAVFQLIALLALPVYLDMMLRKLHIARREADEANRAKSAFLANMSHELRTPLNAIIGYSELLKEEAKDTGQDNLYRDLERINASGRHLSDIISGVLDLSKIEAGKIGLELNEVTLGDLVDEVVNVVGQVMEKRGNHFTVNLNDTARMALFVDVTKLKQVLINLLGNAAKFTSNGRVELEVEQASKVGKSWLYFHVRDTGIGISDDKIDTLFEPFVQADDSTTREYGGTGLGLTISRTYCRMMGGDILVESKLGQGSHFTVLLPVKVNRRGA